MALSCVVSEIFNVEEYRNLQIPVNSQSRSLKVVSLDRFGIVFEIIDFKYAVTLKTRLGVCQVH